MMLYRFSPEKFSKDLSGNGAMKRGGRWNSAGFPVLYTSTTISLSLLELFVYNASYEELMNHYLMRIEVPDIYTGEPVLVSVKPGWQKDLGYSQFIGDSFLKLKKSLLLRVPSAIIPDENNILINPLHPNSKKLKIIDASPFQFDSRLFK